MRLILLITFLIPYSALASGVLSEDEVNAVDRVEINSDEWRERISVVAGLLAQYEIKAKKLVDSLDKPALKRADVDSQAKTLLNLSESIINSARFRLPQCDAYLRKTVELKPSIADISLETLEKDYHHDGALPKAPIECYHTKDLFVHPATVLVLTRDDSSLRQDTRKTIHAEIAEVLGHTDLVRELVIY